MELSDAAIMARSLLREHGLTNLGEGTWRFYFDQSKRRFGACHYSTKSISLSPYLTELNAEDEVRDTILHEIAHAIAYNHFGCSQGHNVHWQRIARDIGAKPERCYVDAHSGGTVQTVRPNYIGTCPSCGNTITRLRLKKASETFACKTCCDKYNGGRWTSRFLLQWTKG